MFAILDIETTGGSPASEKITEIAILFHDGQKVVDEWSTLINPEKSIPYFITGLTGITNEMVADAPRFYEVARELVERTENHTIVGHNVSFDYSSIGFSTSSILLSGVNSNGWDSSSAGKHSALLNSAGGSFQDTDHTALVTSAGNWVL